MRAKIIAITIITKTNERKAMMIKVNEINEATKTIKVIKIEKTNEAIETKTKTKKSVNSKI